MTPERWKAIEQLYERARRREAGERASFLREACGGDEALRREVESLLRYDGATNQFMEIPAFDAAVQKDQIPVGSSLGPYEILSRLGAGGMGEVYKARDRRLDRVVAVKVLAPDLDTHPQMRQRFEREARTIARMNHPHICTLHDIGREQDIDYLVMEYLEGETLAARLSRGALGLEEALRYGVQVLDALDKAHRQGVIHRDLKPGNIMLTKEGAKLLDFGLAKFQVPLSTPDGATALSVGDPSLTGTGMILGTFQYMAPEQLEGKPTDARTDIFAFGLVLYEMVSGRKTFTADNPAALISAVLSSEPPPLSQHQAVPPLLRRILDRCLAKDPESRWQTAHDVGLQLSWLLEQEEGPERAATLPRPGNSFSSRLAPAFALSTFVLALICLYIVLRPPGPGDENPVRFTVSLPNGTIPSIRTYPVLSPDGLHLAFIGTQSSQESLWIRSLDSVTPRVLPGTEQAAWPFWSPDSREIGFVADYKLKKTTLDGGLHVLYDPTRRGEEPVEGNGGTWSVDKTILFSWSRGLYRIPASGGDPEPVTVPSSGEKAHRWPSFLPDGRHFLYTIHGEPERAGIYLGSLDGSVKKRLNSSTYSAVFASPGRVLFSQENTLYAQPFDLSTLSLEGEPVALVQDLGRSEFAGGPVLAGYFSVSATGVLAYRSKSPLNRLVWFNRQGHQLGRLQREGYFFNPALSPDGGQLALAAADTKESRGRDIWTVDLARETWSRVTFDARDETNPTWSPDGRRLAFTAVRERGRSIYIQSAGGDAQESPLLESDDSLNVEDWSRVGDWLLFGTRFGTVGWVSLRGDRQFLPNVPKGPTGGQHSQFSPEVDSIVYTSDETGEMEVYVQRFPSTGEKWRVSTRGGFHPHWRADGREIVYREGNKLMSAQVRRSAAGFEIEPPVLLFEIPFPKVGQQWRSSYVVSADGQRFLVVQEEPNPTPFQVLLHWPRLLANR